MNVLNSNISFVVELFSLGTLVSTTNKMACHDITEILLKVALNTIPSRSVA